MVNDPRNPEVDDADVLNILQKFGKYQIFQYFLVCLPTALVAMNNVNYVFVAGDIDYRCRVPECEYPNKTYSSPWWPTNVSRCSKPVINYTELETNQCSNNSFTSTVTECTDWIYGSNDTIVAWLDLACQPWKTNFVGTVHSFGMSLGMMIGGWCSDRFGRKSTFVVASVTMVVGTIKVFMTNYYAYIFVELVEATLAGGSFQAGMIIMIEISGNDKRILSGVIYVYAIYTGEALLAGVAYLVPYWKSIVYIASTPSIVFISYVILMNESPRWQVLNDKLEEARNTLKAIVKLNNINISSQDVDNINQEKLRQVCNVEVSDKKEGYREIFKSNEMIKRLIVAIIGRFSVTLIYFGLVANSVWLLGNKYTNYFIVSLMSYPGDILALYFMDKVGRKWPLVYGFSLCGVSCIAFAYVPVSLLWLKLLLFFIGKLIVTACYTGIWAYTMELFPTSVRGSMFGLCTFVASAGWMLAPLTPAMETISPVFAFMLFAASAILASLALTLTPETKDRSLVGTIEEADNTVAAVKKIKKNKSQKIHDITIEENGIISIHL